MKHTAIFRFLSMLTVLFYSVTLAQAGQVITQAERSWAKDAIKQDTTLGAAPSPNSIAVVYFNNKSNLNKLNPLEKGMAVMLITDLSKIEEFQVVERVWLQALLDEMDLSDSGTMDAKTIPTVGKLLGAYNVVSGNIFAGSTQNISIDSSIFDIPLKNITRQPSATGALDELFKLEKTVLFNIVDQVNVLISPAKRAELNKPLSTSTAAILALFTGINYSDKGLYADAARMYKQALIEDPDLEVAQNALQELNAMGLASAEDAVPVKEAAEDSAAAVEEGGSSTGIIIGVGVALAAGVGAAVALGSSGGGSDGNATPPPGDQTAPTLMADPGSGGSVSCTEGSIAFSFSKPMNQSVGQVSISPGDFASGAWSSTQLYSVSWSHDSSYCASAPSSVSITFSGFQDTEGIALSGASQFTYAVTSNSTL